jgi:hypothetical protein
MAPWSLLVAASLCVAAARPGDIPPPADVGAPPADSTRTASGLATRVLRPGTGTQHPAIDDSVEVHYTGWTTDGFLCRAVVYLLTVRIDD